MPSTRHDDVDFVNVSFEVSLPGSDDDVMDYCHCYLDVAMSEQITDETEISPGVTKTVFDPSFLLIRTYVRGRVYQKFRDECPEKKKLKGKKVTN